MDPLSEICSTMRVHRAVFTTVVASAPWGVRTRTRAGIKFVLLIDGSCVVASRAAPSPIHLRGGDIFISLDDTPYDTCDSPGSPTIDCSTLLAHGSSDELRVGGGGETCRFFSGCFDVDVQEAAPLLSILPSVLVLDAVKETKRAVDRLLRLLEKETERVQMGTDAMINTLFELLFIHVVRAYCDQQPLPETGWLAITVDPQLKHAARAMHSDLGRDWTLEALASIAGMSRSAFAARFKERSGITPYEYLVRWRMFKAVILLQRSGLSINAIAYSIGYRSERTFNRMFKKQMGTSPGKLKKEHQKKALELRVSKVLADSMRRPAAPLSGRLVK